MMGVTDYFDNNVPALPFRLAVRPTMAVDVATLNWAIELSQKFAYFPPPDVEKFLTKVCDISEEKENNPDCQYDAETQAILDSDGYQRFLFYLTVYTNCLDQLLVECTPAYLAKIGIPLEESVKVEYYPCMYDPATIDKSFGVAFDGDIKKIMLYCRLMHEHFLQLDFTAGEYRISAVDILGQVSRTDPLPESKEMINLRYRRDVSHLVRSVF